MSNDRTSEMVVRMRKAEVEAHVDFHKLVLIAEDWKARALAAEAALDAIIAKHQEWRQCMPADWEGDPLSDAIDAVIRSRKETSAPAAKDGG